MLSIGKLAGGGIGEDYYLRTVAQGVEDYYLGNGEPPGRWLGAGADELGLSGTVDGDQLRAVMAGLNPQTGALLIKPPAGERVPGWDLTFSAPKSTSVLYALGGDGVAQACVEAHEAAVDAALGFLEERVSYVRRGHGGVEHLPSGGWTIAAFRHRTSRAGDPQLHTHALVANLLHGSDGAWSGLDSKAVYGWSKTAGYLYQAQHRQEMRQRLGVEWGPVHNGCAEIRGMPRELLRAYSRRRVEIEDRMDQLGTSSPRAAQTAALDTRKAKEYSVPGEALGARWRAMASQLGYGEETVAAVLGVAGEPPAIDVPGVGARLAGPEGLTKHRTTFTMREVLQAWAAEMQQGADIDEVRRLAHDFVARGDVEVVSAQAHGPGSTGTMRREDGRLVPLRLDGEGRWTTTEMRRIEEDIERWALERRGMKKAVVPQELIASALRRDMALSAEQRVMVHRLLAEGNGVDLVRGLAGAGKTRALRAAHAAWQEAGFSVGGASLIARAGQKLEEGSGIRSSTLDRLLIDLDQGAELPKVLVIDEAQTAPDRKLHRILREARDTKVVLVGDEGQINSTEAGGTFRGLGQRLDAIELRENRRQVEAWERDALEALHDGRVKEALDAYEAHDRLVRAGTGDEARERMVANWWDARQRGEEGVLVAYSNHEVDDLNRRARIRCVEAGEIGGPSIELGGREWAVGDELMTTRNSRSLGVLNGERWRVTALDPATGALTVMGARGERVLPAGYAAPHATYGYTLTGHKVIGATEDQGHLLIGDTAHQEWTYVGASRGRLENWLYVVGEPEPPDLRETAPRGALAKEDAREVLVRNVSRRRGQAWAIDGGQIEQPRARGRGDMGSGGWDEALLHEPRRWRTGNEPATERQTVALQARGAWREGMSKAEASLLLSGAVGTVGNAQLTMPGGTAGGPLAATPGEAARLEALQRRLRIAALMREHAAQQRALTSGVAVGRPLGRGPGRGIGA